MENCLLVARLMNYGQVVVIGWIDGKGYDKGACLYMQM